MDLTKYLLAPYKHLGDEFDGCDCYGLVYLYFLHEFGIEFPRKAPILKGNIKDIEEVYTDWFEIQKSEITTNDVILFKNGSRSIWHIGVCVCPNKIMHSAEGKGTSISKLSRFGNIHSAYRNKTLEAK